MTNHFNRFAHSTALSRMAARLRAHAERRDERGDVPGWVLVTVMSAGIVGVLWQFSSAELQAMLAEALASVTG